MYCYSTNEENYTGDEDSRLDAIAEACADADLPAGDNDGLAELDVWTAESVPTSAGALLSSWAADSLLDSLQDQACEHAGEAGEDYRGDIMPEAEDALQMKLIALVNQWATEHGCQPRFYGVVKVQHHIVTVNAQSGELVRVSDVGGPR